MAKNNSWKNVWEKSSVEKEASFINREVAYTEVFNKYFKPKDKVLEAGCGLGRYCFYLNNKKIKSYGLEIDKKSLKRAKEFSKENNFVINFKLGDVRKLPYPDNFFEGYISLGVIEHFYKENDVLKVFQETKRVLKPGGYAFFSVPNPYSLTYWLPKITFKEKVFHKAIFMKDLKRHCKNTGLSVLSLKYRDFVHPIYTLSVWMTKKDNDKKYSLYKKSLGWGENIFPINKFASGIHLLVTK